MIVRELIIAGRRISDDAEPWVCAEIGANHQGSVARCKDIMAAAAECGVDAVKLQKRDLAVFRAEDPDRWDTVYNSEQAFGRTYGEHRQALEFGWDEYIELDSYAESLGLVFFATAWDYPSVDFLVRLGVPAIKIASASITNYRLLYAASGTRLPLIISTGGAEQREVKRAADIIWERHLDMALLQCTSTYPAEPEHMHLRVIETYRRDYPRTVIGLSDHQNGIAMAVVAYALGARMFEKHFTINRSWKGSDQAFSLERPGMSRLVRDLKRARVAMGDGIKRRLPEEVPALIKMGRRDLIGQTT